MELFWKIDHWVDIHVIRLSFEMLHVVVIEGTRASAWIEKWTVDLSLYTSHVALFDNKLDCNNCIHCNRTIAKEHITDEDALGMWCVSNQKREIMYYGVVRCVTPVSPWALNPWSLSLSPQAGRPRVPRSSGDPSTYPSANGQQLLVGYDTSLPSKAKLIPTAIGITLVATGLPREVFNTIYNLGLSQCITTAMQHVWQRSEESLALNCWLPMATGPRDCCGHWHSDQSPFQDPVRPILLSDMTSWCFLWRIHFLDCGEKIFGLPSYHTVTKGL